MNTFTRSKLGPVAWALLDSNGVEVGRYGGRDGARWAQLADGTLVTDDSRCSAATVRGLLESAIRRALPEPGAKWTPETGWTDEAVRTADQEVTK